MDTPKKSQSDSQTVTPLTESNAGMADSLTVQTLYEIQRVMLKPESPKSPAAREESKRWLDHFSSDDPIEQMLAQQAMILHTRMLMLSLVAARETTLQGAQISNFLADNAASSCRRHLEALANHKDPGRKRATAIKQANVVGQQIVANVSSAEQAVKLVKSLNKSQQTNKMERNGNGRFYRTKRGKESGGESAVNKIIGNATPALPIDTGGAAVEAISQSQIQAVAEIDRPANVGREDSGT